MIALGICLTAILLPAAQAHAQAQAQAGRLSWSAPKRIDLAPGTVQVTAVTCSSATQCIAFDSAGRVFSGAPGTPPQQWAGGEPVPGLSSVEQVVCPTSTLCVAAARGALAVSHGPSAAAGAWTVDQLDGGQQIFSVACPTQSFCIATDSQGNGITSTDPLGGAQAWTIAPISSGADLSGISCPTATFCAAVNGDAVLSTKNPAGGASAWTSTKEGSAGLATISCPTVNLCVAAGFGGVISSTQPENLGVPWNQALVEGNDDATPLSLSCTAAGFCALGESRGQLFTTANPTGPRTGWSKTVLRAGAGYDSISCLAGPVCVVADAAGEVWKSADPLAAKASTWSRTALHGPPIVALSCPSSSFCVGGDRDGNALTSASPSGSTPWSTTQIGFHEGIQEPMTGLSCPTERLCVASFRDSLGGGFGASTTSPTGPRGAWKAIDAGKIGLRGVGCASARVCATIDSHNRLFVSAAPAQPHSWRAASARDQRPGVYCPSAGNCLDTRGSCPSRSLCVDVASGARGAISFSSDPRGGARTWRTTTIDSGHKLSGVSCPTSKLCVAVDSAGNVLSSTHPTGGRAAWDSKRVDGEPLSAVSCPSAGFCVLGDDDGNAITGGTK
jgi:hypothetical protein